jgi:hypothetical protein
LPRFNENWTNVIAFKGETGKVLIQQHNWIKSCRLPLANVTQSFIKAIAFSFSVKALAPMLVSSTNSINILFICSSPLVVLTCRIGPNCDISKAPCGKEDSKAKNLIGSSKTFTPSPTLFKTDTKAELQKETSMKIKGWASVYQVNVIQKTSGFGCMVIRKAVLEPYQSRP